MKARVTVTLKSGILDPQGKAIEGALKSLGVAGVASVRQGKVFDIELKGKELGVDMGEAFPKPLTDEVVRAADVVVTMGCGDACPIYPGKRYEDWELDDPAGQDLETVRRIRDELDRRVQKLIAELLPAERATSS